MSDDPSDAFAAQFVRNLDVLLGRGPLSAEVLAAKRRFEAKRKRTIHQGCGRVMGHGEYCCEGWYCGPCEGQAKRQADALAAGWPMPL